MTLPSVKTNYTERSETHEKEKEEPCRESQAIRQDLGLPRGVPVEDGLEYTDAIKKVMQHEKYKR